MTYITKPSFRRKILRREWISTTTESTPKTKESKYKKVTISTKTVTSEYMLILSCGHTYHASRYTNEKTKSIDCFECSLIWQKENNCDWRGILND